MRVRQMLTGLGFLVMCYAAAPLLETRAGAFDVCCSATGECPDGLACMRSASCGQESQGYCVPIEVIGGSESVDR